MNLGSIVVLLSLFALAACSEPLEFAEWTIGEVPVGGAETSGSCPLLRRKAGEWTSIPPA